MAALEVIQACVSTRRYLFSKHAADRLIVRGISVAEVEQVLLGSAEVIENYPLDKYGPSCLILGYTGGGRPPHVQYAYTDPLSVKLETVYEPHPDRWIDLRTRRRSQGD